MSAIQYLKNDDGIIILTLDSPNQSANTMNADFRVALENIVSKLKSETSFTQAMALSINSSGVSAMS